MCMQVFLYWPKQYTFLCGYYGKKVYWCGDAGGFVRKSGSDAEFHGDTCTVSGGGGGEGAGGGGGGGEGGGLLKKVMGSLGGIKKPPPMSCDDKNRELGFNVAGDGGGGDEDEEDLTL
jgi:hypothetical protein